MNKLGFYIQNSQGTHDHISNVQPPVILMHAWDQGLLQDIRRFRSPDAFVVGRMDYIGQGGGKKPVDQTLVNSWLDGPDPAARGREFAEHILTDNFQLATRKGENGRLLVDAWMSLNECIPGPASGAYSNSATERAEIEGRLRAYDKFQAAFRSKLMEQGVEAVAFNFGAGNFGSAAHYADFFPETLASYTYLGFHEYGWPSMRPDPAAGIFSSAGSYRPIVNGLRQRTGRSYKAIITEAGLARMFKHNQDGVGDVGWLYPEDSVSQEDYWRSLDWFNDYLVQDDFAVGACLFQVGVGAGWQTFRHFGPDGQGSPIQLLDRVRQLRDKTDHRPQPSVGEAEAPSVPPVVTPPVEQPPVVTPSPVVTPPSSGATHSIFLPIVMGGSAQPGRVPVQEKVGLDANRPIDPESGAAAAQVGDPGIIAETGVGWVRLNFVLGQAWSSVADAGWQARYSQIIAGFRGRGLKIYGLISDEAMSAPPGDQFRDAPPAGAAQDEWLDRYVDTFVAIVRRFHADVSVFESFNEPDDWHGSQRHWVHPGWYALILQTLYERVKSDPLIRHITLVSGPLQGLSNNNNGGVRYLAAAYQEGKQRFGWGSRAPFPFDGVGYHLYAAQNPTSTDEQIIAQYNDYLSDLRRVIREAEGQAKPLYLSEFGWFSNHNNENFQERAMRIGLKAAVADPSLALVIWFCTQDFGGDNDFKHYGLYRQGPINPENRKPGVYRCFQEILRTPGNVPVAIPGAADTTETEIPMPITEARIPRIYTNQQAIDSVYNSALKLGLADVWAIFAKAGQDVAVLAQDRTARYAGPALDETPSLTANERVTLREELLERLVETARWDGLVTATDGLSMRVGPGGEHDRLRFLGHEERVQVLDDSSSWLFVLAGGTPGYCSADWVMRQVAPAPVSPTPTGNAVGLLRTWTRHGQLLQTEAGRLGIEPAVAVAVLLTESGGDGFGPDGRLKIRFENHVFLQQWGAQNKPDFEKFFAFSPQESWKGHQWRADPGGDWQNCHQSQAQEWEVLDFARNLTEEPALKSISMGSSQIMGFNFAALGYGSARAMFDDFQTGEEAQIRALFRFVENRHLVQSLRQRDYVAFARGYNGPGQPEFYAGIIQGYVDLFNREIGGARGLEAASVPASVAAEAAPGERGLASHADVQSRLPVPEGGGTLAQSDPQLYSFWRQHMQKGFENNQTMFDQILNGFMGPYWTTVWMYRILFAVGILAFVAAIVMAYVSRDNPTTAIGTAAVFGGLSVASFLSYFLSRPLQALEENLQFITWLGILYNSYWTRLAYLSDNDSVQEGLEDVTNDTIAGIKELLASHAERTGKRPGAG